MLRRAFLTCLLLTSPLVGAAQTQPNNDRVPVEVVATASEYIPNSVTFSNPGHSFTDCSGSTSYFGQFYGNSVSGTADTRTSCSTTSYPPTESTFTLYRRVNYTVVKSARALYLLTCTQRWRWSKCPSFAIGTKYFLTVEVGKQRVLLDATGSKPIKLDYLSSVALPEPQATTPAEVAPPRADGHWWQSQSKDFKLGFLIGYVSALNTAMSVVDPKGEKYPGFHFGNYTVGQMCDELDEFYADASNQHIQIELAITWVKDKFEGSSQEELQKTLESLRKEESR